MTTLVKIYATKKERRTVEKVISLLEQAGIEAFTTGITLEDQLSFEMAVFVKKHEHDKAEQACCDIYFSEHEKLPGEFIGMEARNPKGEFVGLNVFYNVILHYQWRNNLAPEQPEQTI